MRCLSTAIMFSSTSPTAYLVGFIVSLKVQQHSPCCLMKLETSDGTAGREPGPRADRNNPGSAVSIAPHPLKICGFLRLFATHLHLSCYLCWCNVRSERTKKFKNKETVLVHHFLPPGYLYQLKISEFVVNVFRSRCSPRLPRAPTGNGEWGG